VPLSEATVVKHAFLDQYSDRDSFVHGLDARTKLIAALLYVLAVVLTPPGSWIAFAAYFALIAALVLVSRVPVLHVLKRSLTIVPFVALVAISLPFFKGGEVAGSFRLWSWEVSVSYSGLLLFATILARAWLSILSVILLTSTTRMGDLLTGMGRLGMPRVMVMILSFMYRYIFVLVDEVMRMKQARDSRNFGGKRLWQIRTIGNMIGTLFIRSYERGERVYDAMLARGFDGRTKTIDRSRFRRADACFAIGFVAVLVGVSVVNICYPVA